VPVTVGLVMSDQALLAGAHDTAQIQGHGPIPVDLARSLVADVLDSGSRLWLRRLYTHPETSELVAMDSHQRLFRGQLREFVNLRDQFCRNAWCGAPIRHRDHLTRVADGGRTTAEGGQGLCEDCNYVKQAAGWRAHVVETTTPTGHTYSAPAPPLIGLRRGAYREVTDGLWHLIA
jgi:hypothetical protein